ncbi:hypothetical protein [Pseudomonas sp. Marseille-QA0892]
MDAAAIFWAPILGMILMGWIICGHQTFSLARHRRISSKEWVSRMTDASLIAALAGLPISFGLYVVASSGM